MIMARIKTLVAAAVLVQGTLRAADGGAEGKVEGGEILGHGVARYRADMGWAKADPAVAPVINARFMPGIQNVVSRGTAVTNRAPHCRA